MGYYKLLGLCKEPFSTTPDPLFFYKARGHMAAFYRLRVAIDLKRGLNLILGDVGTGKSTLMRKLMAALGEEPEYCLKAILDPCAPSELDFLAMLAAAFGLKPAEKFYGLRPGAASAASYKKIIEHFLFEEAVVNGRTVVLFIDEAQKLSDASQEVLRILLNYETNEIKLIQTVLFGQMELLSQISRMANLWDRIAFKYVINPLEKDELRELIQFRLKRAGYFSHEALFDEGALQAIYDYSQGYPRKITMLCHNALEYLVMHGRRLVDREVIEALMKEEVRVPEIVNGRS